MRQEISPLIQAKELLELYGKEHIILVDATNGPNAKAAYQQRHLKGALFVDLNEQLADIKSDAAQGGRHPLPTLEQFSKTLSALGISKESHVVIYDDKNGSNAAARFWWMLRAAGHEKVQVLNGGFRAAEKAGFPVSGEMEKAEPVGPYPIENWKLPLADMSEVEAVARNSNHLVIDVRDSDRYNAKTEPIDLIAGHIPGAVNIPFSENLDANDHFLPAPELKEKYEKAFAERSAENIIVHCGSGVTACHTLLAIAYAGLAIPKLYVGSWSEWSRNDKPLATGL
ncbi:sulfurtransferase [Flaviaesturariibacter terrae]